MVANRLDRGSGQPDLGLGVRTRKADRDPIHVHHQGQRFKQHRVNRPDTRLYLTWPLCRRKALAMRKPSTQNVYKEEQHVIYWATTTFGDLPYNIARAIQEWKLRVATSIAGENTPPSNSGEARPRCIPSTAALSSTKMDRHRSRL